MCTGTYCTYTGILLIIPNPRDALNNFIIHKYEVMCIIWHATVKPTDNGVYRSVKISIKYNRWSFLHSL